MLGRGREARTQSGVSSRVNVGQQPGGPISLTGSVAQGHRRTWGPFNPSFRFSAWLCGTGSWTVSIHPRLPALFPSFYILSCGLFAIFFETPSASFRSFIMMFPRSSVQLAALALSLFCSFVYFLGGRTVQDRFSAQHGQDAGSGNSLSFISTEIPPVPFDEPASDPIRNIQNATLGFQKIYVISMPSRTDKRDYLTLMALVSGLDITFADGVNGSDMHPRSLPAVGIPTDFSRLQKLTQASTGRAKK